MWNLSSPRWTSLVTIQRENMTRLSKLILITSAQTWWWVPLPVLTNYCLNNSVLKCCLYLPECFMSSLTLPWTTQFIVIFSSWKSLSLRKNKTKGAELRNTAFSFIHKYTPMLEVAYLANDLMLNFRKHFSFLCMNKHEKYERLSGMKYCYVILETSEYMPTGNLGLGTHACVHTHTQTHTQWIV